MVINTYTEGHVNIKDLLIVTGSASTSCLILNNIACIYIFSQVLKKYTAVYVIPRKYVC